MGTDPRLGTMPVKLDLKTPRALRDDSEYEMAVSEMDRLLDKDPAEGTPAADRLELLSILVEAYDDKYHNLEGHSTPQSIVEFALDQHAKTRADLVPILGSKSRVSEFLNGKRRLSMTQIGALRQAFGIPADLLIETDESGPAEKKWPGRGAKVARVSEDSPRYELSKGHAAAGEPALLQTLLMRVDALTKSVEENTKLMKALLAELRRRR
jgi:HTH-type transcriptional regulator/antitoxin HigA